MGQLRYRENRTFSIDKELLAQLKKTIRGNPYPPVPYHGRGYRGFAEKTREEGGVNYSPFLPVQAKQGLSSSVLVSPFKLQCGHGCFAFAWAISPVVSGIQYLQVPQVLISSPLLTPWLSRPARI